MQNAYIHRLKETIKKMANEKENETGRRKNVSGKNILELNNVGALDLC